MKNTGGKSLFISMVGRPNVGKSTILNMIVGEKISIVSPKPQTTRNKIRGILTINDTQLVFIDTPGLHTPKTKLGDFMIKEINSSFSDSEAIMHIVEAGKSPSAEDLKFAEKFKLIGNTPVILVINKIDLLESKSELLKNIKEYNEIFDYDAVIPISAINCDGRDELISEFVKLAKPSVFFFDSDDITDKSEREICSEIIREKMLYFLSQELPYGVAVAIERFHINEKTNLLSVDALIQCEKANHKSIIIGKGGNMLKKIGIEARKDIEKMMNCKVNLKMWVKVKENWRNCDFILKDMGYVLE